MNKQATRDDAEFLSLARERFNTVWTEEQEIRQKSEDDLLFVAGEQWTEEEIQKRKANGMPILQFNKLPAHVQQVANEARQNKPQIKYSPVDGGADKDTAIVLEGLARHIQYSSDADVAFETALDYAASCGFGYFRFLTDYCTTNPDELTPANFNALDLKIETVVDPFRIYGALIPAIMRQKCRYAFVVETITKDEFKARFGEDVEPSNLQMGEVSHLAQWCFGDRVQIAEYWHIETERRKQYLITNGSENRISDSVPDGWEATAERLVSRDVIKSCMIDGTQILPGTETVWPGSCIPIVAVLGQMKVVQGKPRLFSLIRHSKDAQKLVNVAKSRIAATLGIAPISPWLVEAGQIEDFQDEWKQAHERPLAALRYHGVNIAGTPAPAPHRQVYEPPVAALSGFVLQETQDIKESTSIYDSSLGDRSNETSGVAIRGRQKQSSLTNFHFIDNLARAHRTGGRIIAEVVPVVYDTEREIRIIGEDEQERIVRVNTLWKDPETGKSHTYSLTTGKYDVTVKTGPGYPAKRDEAFELLGQFAQAYPDLMAVAGDIIFENSDIPGADRVAARLKKRIPQELLSDDEKAKDGQAPGEPSKAEVSQLMQQHELLTQQVQVLSQQVETKQLELESRERIATAQLDVKREEITAKSELEMAKLGSAEWMQQLAHHIAAIMADVQSDRQAEQAERQFQQQQQVSAEQQPKAA
jgi:hypothetical protein